MATPTAAAPGAAITPIGTERQPKGTWRRLAATKIQKICGMAVDPKAQNVAEQLAHIQHVLEGAKAAMNTKGSLCTWWTGEQVDHTYRLLHEAEADRVALLPDDQRIARMKEVLFDAANILDRSDPVLALRLDDKRCVPTNGGPTQGAPGDSGPTGSGPTGSGPRDGSPRDGSRANARELVLRYRAAWDDRYVRSRNFRNRLIVLIATVSVGVVVVFLAGWGGLFTVISTDGQLRLHWPDASWQAHGLIAMLAIATFGGIGGLLAGSGQVVQAGGVYNPFYLPIASLILKVQMGALCAQAGVLAVLGGIAPELTATDWADVIVWALVFGAAQQLVTRLVDRRVSALVSSTPQETVLKK